MGPRDGLQNEKAGVSTDSKVALIEALVDAGVKTVECGSFVSPKWVPQMADTAEVLAHVRRVPGVRYPVLVPNVKGLDAAIDAGVRDIAVFTAASETFSRRNTNASIDESLARIHEVADRALGCGMMVRGYVSCVLGCPYEGAIARGAVARVAAELDAMGCYEISLGDTIGVGTPLQARTMLETVAERVPVERLALHFHDTYGQALANIVACLDLGARVVDSSVAGLGGCPYAPGATGNVATEDVVYMLNGMDIKTGIDLAKLAAAGRAICAQLARASASKVAMALAAASSDS